MPYSSSNVVAWLTEPLPVSVTCRGLVVTTTGSEAELSFMATAQKASPVGVFNLRTPVRQVRRSRPASYRKLQYAGKRLKDHRESCMICAA